MALSRPNYKADRSSPAENLKTIVPADADLDPQPLALRVVAAGTVAWRNTDGSDESADFVAGERLEVQVLRVRVGTTATVMGYFG